MNHTSQSVTKSFLSWWIFHYRSCFDDEFLSYISCECVFSMYWSDKYSPQILSEGTHKMCLMSKQEVFKHFVAKYSCRTGYTSKFSDVKIHSPRSTSEIVPLEISFIFITSKSLVNNNYSCITCAWKTILLRINCYIN